VDSLTICKIAEKIFKKYFEVKVFPFSDGGDGFLDIVRFYIKGKVKRMKVTGIDGSPIFVPYLVKDDTVFIESAEIFGLKLLRKYPVDYEKRTTKGLGEMIINLSKKGYKKFIIGFGGTATVDAGTGVIVGAGGKIMDEKGNNLKGRVKDFLKIHEVEFKGIQGVNIECWCDVENPLLGKESGIRIYSAQKGVERKKIKEFMKACKKFVHITKDKRKVDVGRAPYTGAAGGVPAALKGWFNAELKSGGEEIIKISGIEERLKNADVLITGEGMLDYQTSFGKIPVKLARIARKYKTMVIGIAGEIKDHEILKKLGFDALFSIVQGPISLEKSLEKSCKNLNYFFESIAEVFKGVIR